MPRFMKKDGKGKSVGSLIEKGPVVGPKTYKPLEPAPVQKGIARGIAAMKSKMKGGK